MSPIATQLKFLLEIFVDYYLQTMYTVDLEKNKMFPSISFTSMCQMKHLEKFKGLFSCHGKSPFPTSYSGSVPKDHVSNFLFSSIFSDKNNNFQLDLCLKHSFEKNSYLKKNREKILHGTLTSKSASNTVTILFHLAVHKPTSLSRVSTLLKYKESKDME